MGVKQLDDGKWQARWRDETGRQRARRFPTKRAATNFLNETLTDIGRGVTTAVDSALTVESLADQWIAASIHLRPRTIETYRRDLSTYIVPRLGDVKVAALKPEMIQAYLTEQLTRLEPSSVHRHYRTLHTMFNWAIRMRYVVANPCTPVNPPRIPKGTMTIFTVEQIEAIATNITPRYRVFVLLLAYGGFRFSEAVGLRRRDFDGKRITVDSQLQKIEGRWVRSDPKTDAGVRSVILPSSIVAEIDAHLEQFTGPAPDDLMFTNAKGDPVGHTFRSSAWALACVKSGMGVRVWDSAKATPNGPRHLRFRGVPHPHDLRHTSVALAIAAGAHPKTIQHRLGHSSIAVTMDTYGHLFAGIDEGLADDLDAMRISTTT